MDDVSFAISPGETLGLVGESGSGKSTTGRAILRRVEPTAGRVFFQGQDITNQPPDRIVDKGISYVPQTENVFPSLSINENLEMGAYLRRDGLQERLELVYDLFPELASRRGDNAGKLSGGQRQMLALARALMLDPQVLLLDEPSASLSPKMVDSLFEKICEINRGGTAILLVEQNAREALSFSSRGYVLATGENRLEGEAKGLLTSEEVGKLYLGV